MVRYPPTLVCLIALFSLLVVGFGCASTSSPGLDRDELATTTLTSIDLVQMTDAMARSLLAAEIDFQDGTGGGAGAGEGEVPFIIVTERVVNRTNHIIDAGEKELFLIKLRSLLNQQGTLKQAGVVFVARPDELSGSSEPMAEGGEQNHVGPTHALTATFATLTNIDRERRADTYECAFQLQELRTRLVIWEDAYTVQYSARRGKMW